MIYNGDLIKIDGKKIPYIQEYEVERAKLWKNGDRNMNGDIRAILIGVFPKIKLKIGYMTQAEMSEFCSLLDKDYFEVSWYDVRVQDVVTAKYYASDYPVSLYSKHRGIYKPFSVSLVPVSKRSY